MPRVAKTQGGVRDPLGLRRVLGDRLLPVLVGAMAFLAALALGGALAAQAWADRWRLGAGTALTAQVPRPEDPVVAGEALSRLDRSLVLLHASPAIASAQTLTQADLDALLRPWLGTGQTVPPSMLPAVIAVHAAPGSDSSSMAAVAEQLETAVPGASLESHDAWVGRLGRLLRGLEACGWGTLILVATVATLVIAAATRAGLVARRATVDILHGLGATDGYVASRFARRATALAATGGVTGTALAVPVLIGLARLAAGFADPSAAGSSAAGALPMPLWIGLGLLPLTAAGIGYVTAQATVRLWLRRLP